MAPQVEEDPIYCAPRYARGHGGVAIFWRKNIDHLVQKLPSLSNHRVVGIQLSTKYHNLCFLSTYLPTRSGCTDQFKESLDYLDSVLTQMGSDHDTLILGDLNADIGLSGGPYCTSNANEQERILQHYLSNWNQVSAHLNIPQYPPISPPPLTYLFK